MYEISGSSGSYSQTLKVPTRREADAEAKSILKGGWQMVTISRVRPMSAYTLTYKIVAMWVREGGKMVKVTKQPKSITR